MGCRPWGRTQSDTTAEASRVEGPGRPPGKRRAEKARERLAGRRGLLGLGFSGEGWAEGPRGAVTRAVACQG